LYFYPEVSSSFAMIAKEKPVSPSSVSPSSNSFAHSLHFLLQHFSGRHIPRIPRFPQLSGDDRKLSRALQRHLPEMQSHSNVTDNIMEVDDAEKRRKQRDAEEPWLAAFNIGHFKSREWRSGPSPWRRQTDLTCLAEENLEARNLSVQRANLRIARQILPNSRFTAATPGRNRVCFEVSR